MAFAALLLVGLAAGPRVATAADREDLRGLLADSLGFLLEPPMDRAQVSVLAVSLDRGDTLAALDPSLRLIPGSNQKLFTTGAFLAQVGPETRFMTRLWAKGHARFDDRDSSVAIDGDLWFPGNGVPDLTALLEPGARGLPDSLAFLLREVGLRRLKGTLWVDGTLFDPERHQPGAMVEDLPHAYGAPVGAILIDGHASILSARGAGRSVEVTLDPPQVPLRVVNRMTVGGGGSTNGTWIDVRRAPGSRTLEVRGVVPPGGLLRTSVAWPEPDSTAGLVLLGAMDSAGIDVRGARVRVGRPPDAPSPSATDTVLAVRFPRVHKDGWTPVLTLPSPTAAEVVGVVNALSLNLEAEALLRHLDPADSAKAREPGIRVLLDRLQAAGIDTLEVAPVDGSGLSTQNLATTRAIVTWLTWINRDSLAGPAFREGLARPGAKGSLKNRLQATADGAAVRAKTGTLSNVSALSGYVTSAGGERIVFSILSNGNRRSVGRARVVEDAFVSLLSRFRRPVAASRPLGIPR